MKPINETLHDYYDFVCNKYGEEHILGVFLYGSQNYGISTKESDIDARAIYIPSILEICGYDAPSSRELIWEETGAHIEVQDIRLMIEIWKKMNINALEILFTSFCVINPCYLILWKRLLSKSEDIAHYNKYRAIKSAYFQAANLLRDTKITSKQYVNALRLNFYLDKYIIGRSYLECIRVFPPDAAEEMKKEKLQKKEYSREDEIIRGLSEKLNWFYDYAERNKNSLQSDTTEIDKFLTKWCAIMILRTSPEVLTID